MFKKVTRTRKRVEKGLDYMQQGQFKAAIKYFEAAVRSRDGSNLERDTAAWWMVNAAKYRKEWKKEKYGNAHLFDWTDIDHSGKAWSDIDIAAVLLTPNTRKLNSYLSKFLGRSIEAIRFQRRYANGRPLKSWKAESGKRYTRFTQTRYVSDRLGV
jgi:tetratricopeptide (TPR) repeat protein